jgi:hypothetical protein
VLHIISGLLKTGLKSSGLIRHGLGLEHTLEFGLRDKKMKCRTKPVFERRLQRREGICFGLVFLVRRRGQP